MNKSYDVIIEKDCDGFYVATVPEIPGCHTQAKSLEELMQRTKEIIELLAQIKIWIDTYRRKKYPAIAANAKELSENKNNDMDVATSCFKYVRDEIKHSNETKW